MAIIISSHLSLATYTKFRIAPTFFVFGFRTGSVRFPARVHPGVQLGIRALGTPQSHPRRYALERQDGLPPQPRRNPQFLRIALAAPPQVCFRPLQSFQFFGHNPVPFVYRRLLTQPATGAFPRHLLNLFEHPPPKFRAPKTPTPPQSLKRCFIGFRQPLLFHSPLKFQSSLGGVPPDAMLPKQPIHPQPARTMSRCRQIAPKTAPGIAQQPFLGPQ